MQICNSIAVRLGISGLILLAPGLAQVASDHYAIYLSDEPAAARFSSREAIRSTDAQTYRQQIEARQRTLRETLAARNITVVGSVSTLANAVFVSVPASRVAELEALPGVAGVVRMRRYKRHLNHATQLMNAPAAWNALGGVGNAGAGIKIAILDTGIDQTHPAFQDSSLTAPPGFPKCTPGDCAFTNNKVIVARSYVHLVSAGTDPNNPAVDSKPDDYSARDRDGHGTAVASAAAANTNSGAVTFNGMAPKAYLGSYKVYGSPGVNDFLLEDVGIQAIEDALNDGMDIANLSSGGPAFTGPLDSGATCGNKAGVPCDPMAQAFENAAKAGMVVTVSAGNENGTGSQFPTFSTVGSPANAPSVIAVGATTNSHILLPTVSVSGPATPSNLKNIAAQYSDSFAPFGALTAPLVDITQLGNDGYACSALPAGSLSGAFALIERGPVGNPCTFAAKAANAQNAGAVGIVFYMADSSTPINPEGVDQFFGPAEMISNTDGLTLKSYIDSNPGQLVIIDPSGREQSIPNFNELAAYSSLGPNVGDYAIKPELVATGGDQDFNLSPDPNDFNLFPPTELYLAAENYDPNGEVYSSTRYAGIQGTSFSAPITAGAAALIKQNHPNFTAADIKSALVNNAAQSVISDDAGDTVTVQYIGAGLLDAGSAVSSTVVVNPTTFSFGVLSSSSSLPLTKQIQVTNHGSSALTLNAAIAPSAQAAGVTLALDKQSLTLNAGATGTLSLTLSGTVPAAGSYYGAVTLQASGVSLRVPYLFLVGDGVPFDLIPLNTPSDGIIGEDTLNILGPMAFKVTDKFGVPIANSAVIYTVSPSGGVTFNSVPGEPACTPATSNSSVSCPTDSFGNAFVDVVFGSQASQPTINATAAGATTPTSLTIRPQPTITGIVNAASFTTPIAPGSFVSIGGTGLSDPGFIDSSTTVRLPLMIDGVTVSFDVPSAHISVPGHLSYVSPTFVNVQVPWELQGQTSAQVKITINEDSFGNVFTVPIAQYTPAFIQVNGIAGAWDSSYHVITASNPATRGQMVSLFANGLGPVTNQPASGDPALANPLSQTTTTPVVMIGGQQAQVLGSALTPGYPALYMMNVIVPSNLSTGNSSVTVSIGGQTSPAAMLPIQ